MISTRLPDHIFLFGHRQQHGKDTCSDLLKNFCEEQNFTHSYSFFARLLKKQVAERYNLNFEKMEEDTYKNWCPPWVNPKEVEVAASSINDARNGKALINEEWFEVVPRVGKLPSGNIIIKKPRTVRDILIEEGNKGRSIWQNTWAAAAYRDLFESNSQIGIISDFRFPNEYDCFQDVITQYINSKYGNNTISIQFPKIHRVLVHRPAGIFKNDGADNELPDLEDPDSWDFIIKNDIEGNGWKQHLSDQIQDMLYQLKIIGV